MKFSNLELRTEEGFWHNFTRTLLTYFNLQLIRKRTLKVSEAEKDVGKVSQKQLEPAMILSSHCFIIYAFLVPKHSYTNQNLAPHHKK